MKQGQTTFLLLCLLGTAPLASAKAHFAAAPAATHASGGGGHGGGTRRVDPRKAPPMAPSRHVIEQDCSKPVDFSAGNLKCK